MPGTCFIAVSKGSASSIVASGELNVNLASVFLPVAAPGAVDAVEAELFVAVGWAVAGAAVAAAAVALAVGALVGTSVGPATINAGTAVCQGNGVPGAMGGEVGCGGNANGLLTAAGAAAFAGLDCGATAGAAGAEAQLINAMHSADSAPMMSTRLITMSS